jgi:membrane fusion protein (multidrug efflux system)
MTGILMKRFIIGLIALAIVAGLGYGAWWFDTFRASMIKAFFAQPRPPITVSTVTVEPEQVEPVIQSIGTIRARQGVDVPARTAGIVKQILFASNQSVEKGQLLIQLDDETEQADMIAAKANEARDAQALKRASALNDRGFSSTSELDNATAALDASRSQLERVQASINLKKIVAPFSGTIGIALVDEGQYLQAGTAIATLQDLEVMKVDFTVPEQQLPLVSIGQEIKAGLTEGQFSHRGKITGIDPKIDPQSRLVSLQAEVDNSEGLLRPGQFAFVEVVLPPEPNVIALPQTAVVQSLYGTYVFRVIDAKPEEGAAADAPKKQIVEQVFVTAGRRFGGEIEITKGISAGDVIVNAGQNKLAAGNSVVIDNTITPAAAGMATGE